MIRAEDRPDGVAEWHRAAEMVVTVTAGSFGVTKESLLNRSRSTADVAFARQTAMYLLHVVFGGTYQQTGEVFGRERTTVAYACSLVEDERDDAPFDRRLDQLEDTLERLWYLDRLRRLRGVRALPGDRAAA